MRDPWYDEVEDWERRHVSVPGPLRPLLRADSLRRYDFSAQVAKEAGLRGRVEQDGTIRFFEHLADSLGQVRAAGVHHTDRDHAKSLARVALQHLDDDDLDEMIHDLDLGSVIKIRDVVTPDTYPAQLRAALAAWLAKFVQTLIRKADKAERTRAA